MRRYIGTVKTLLNIANDKFILVIQMFMSYTLYNLSSLLPPLATSGIIAVITDNNFNGIWYYAFLYVLFYAIYFSMHYWEMYTYTKLAEYYHLEVKKKLFSHVANNDSIFNKISKGKITDTCSDDVRYLVDVLDVAAGALACLVQLVVIFLIFSYYNIIVALVAVVIDLFYFILMNDNSKKVSRYYEGTRKYEDKMIDTLNQILLSLKQIKSLNMMSNLNKNLDKTRKKWSHEYKNKRKNLIIRKNIMPFIIYGGKILLYVFLGYLVVNGQMKLDKLVLLISYFELTMTCMDDMLNHLLDLSNYGIRVKRIKAVLDYNQNSNIDFGDVTNDYINGTVTFDSVSYAIKNKLILNKVSFKIYPNEITAIVGHSGAGKTTIMNLLYRLDRIKSGSILIDDENILNYTKKVYSSNVSGVFQKPFMFDMSIKDNLSLIDSNYQNQIEACKRVGIHDTIENLPKGYNTVITNEERLLTDGEKQLIVIARALLSKAEILLFDEVTSNIDPAFTPRIGEVIKDLKEDHTIIMITHKSEMMDIADRIIVMDKGKVVCKGTNEEVFNKSALYRELKNRTFASISNVEE